MTEIDAMTHVGWALNPRVKSHEERDAWAESPPYMPLAGSERESE